MTSTAKIPAWARISSVPRSSKAGSLRGPAPELLAGDRALVNLVGPVGQAERAQVGVHRGQREVVADPGATVDLNRPIDHAQRNVGSGDLDRRDLASGVLVADGVRHPSGLHGQ